VSAATTKRATTFSALLIASAIPSLVFVLVGGVAADRYSRRRIMLLSDAGRALTLGVVAALGLLGLLQLWHLVALAVIFGFVRLPIRRSSRSWSRRMRSPPPTASPASASRSAA
jgi:MFS family permease